MPDDLDNEPTDGGALRKQLEKALADLKAANDARSQLEAQVRSVSIKELFAEVKADPRGAKFYNGEPTKEALAEWLKSDGDVFATAPEPQAQTPGTTETAEPLPPGITPEMLAGAQATAGMQPTPPAAPTGDLDVLTGQLSGLSFDKPEDVTKLQATFGAIRAQAAAKLAAGGTL